MAGCRRDGFLELSWCTGAQWCEVRRCVIGRGLVWHHECGPVGCRKGLLAEKVNAHAFSEFARRHGTGELLDCLERNERTGVAYHCEGITGANVDLDDLDALVRFIITSAR